MTHRLGDNEIGNRIAKLRRELGLTLRQLSTQGIGHAYLSRIEKGHRHPSVAALVVIAETLQTTALFLLTGDGGSHCPVCHRGPD